MKISGAVRTDKITNLLLRGLFNVKALSYDEVGWWAQRLGNTAYVDGLAINLDNRLLSEYFKGMLVLGWYEKYEREIIQRYLPKDEPVIELGASIGVVSCIVNSRLKAPDRHVVVEANPELIPTLRKNRALNGCQFTIIEAAIGYGGDTISFYTNGVSLLGSIYLGCGEKMEVPTRSLQSIAEEAGFHHFTLVSDIEGSEIDLLEHEIDFIREHVGVILMETHDDTPCGEDGVKRVLDTLAANGFALVDGDHNNYCFRKRACLKGAE